MSCVLRNSTQVEGGTYAADFFGGQLRQIFATANGNDGADQDWSAVLSMELPAAGRLVVALVGLAFEARIAAGPGVFVICRNTGDEIAALLDVALRRGCRNIISFGLAGGLAPNLRAGDWVVASSVIDAKQTRPTDQTWSKKILTMIPGAGYAPILGVDTAITDIEGKRRVHAETGAAAVDMESHLVARLAAAHGLSFTAVRVVIDPAHRFVPAAALAGMLPGGKTSIAAVMREVIARPSQLLGLIRITFDAHVAHGALRRTRRILGPGFGQLSCM